MTYSKQTWADGEDGNTPIDAAALNHIEDGVVGAYDAIATKADTAYVDNVGDALATPDTVARRDASGLTWFSGVGIEDAPFGPAAAVRKDYVDALFNSVGSGGSGSVPWINVRTQGATGNGTTDDSAAVQSAYDAANTAGGGVVYFPAGTYLVGDLKTYSSTTSRGAGAGASILSQLSTSTYVLSVNPGSDGTADPANNIHDVVIEDLGFRGRVDTAGFVEHTHLLNLNAVTRAHVSRCNFVGWQGDGIYVGSSNTAGVERHNKQVWITECFFDGINKDNRNGVSVIDGEDVEISRCVFTRCTRSTMPGAIDIEPDRQSFHVIRNIRILDNDFSDIDGFGCVSVSLTPDQGTLTTPSQNIYIEGNTFNAPNTMGIYAYSETPAPSDSTVPHNLFIRNNISRAGTYPYEISGLRGVYLSGNLWLNNSENARIGQWYPVHELTVTGDTYDRVADAATGAVFRVYQVTKMTVDRCRFLNCGKADGTSGAILLLLGSGGYANELIFTSNYVTGARTTTLATLQGGGSTTATQNIATGNRMSLTIPTTVFNAPASVLLWRGTQAAYDALAVKDASTLYVIAG